MPRNIFIGDVHGCLDEFQELIKIVDPKPEDTLVQVGDLIHKGPDSAGVVDFWNQYNRSQKVLIFGNHEEKHVRWLRTEAKRLATGAENKMSYVEEYPSTGITSERELILRNSYLAKTVGNTLAVHAGIPAALTEPIPEITHDEWLALPTRQRISLGQILRVRFLARAGKTRTNSKGQVVEVSEGKMLALGQHDPMDPYWAETYDGRYGTVAFGHNPFMLSRPAIFKHAYGIDLGCVHGGHLCALIENNGLYSYKTVRAKRVYKERPAWTYE